MGKVLNSALGALTVPFCGVAILYLLQKKREIAREGTKVRVSVRLGVPSKE